MCGVVGIQAPGQEAACHFAEESAETAALVSLA